MKIFYRLALATLLLTISVNIVVATPQRGGVLKVGIQVPKNLNPHTATNSPEMIVAENIYQHLTIVDKDSNLLPELATKWYTEDSQNWTFDLKKDAKFSIGTTVTPEDIIFSFQRIMDPKVGSPLLKMMANIDTIKKTGDAQVTFYLKETNPEFARDVSETQACIIPANTKNFKRPIGSGFYKLSEYYPEQLIVLERNPYYADKDKNGVQLPYFDTVEMTLSNDFAGQTEALVGGQIDFQGGLTIELANTVRQSKNLVLETRKDNMHYMIHFRSDKGHIGSNAKLVKAFKLATNHQKIADTVRPDLAFTGNGFSPVGPAYGKYFLNTPPKTDIEKAKQFLAEAGYSNGIEIDVVVPNSQSIVSLATVWREQLAKIGAKANLKVIPVDVYFGKGDDSWLNCDIGITNWGPRSTPIVYFKMAYITGAPWNGSHWSNPEFDKLVNAIAVETNDAKRIKYYHQAQQIMIDQGPFINAMFEKSAIGMNKKLKGTFIPGSWSRVRFGTSYFE